MERMANIVAANKGKSQNENNFQPNNNHHSSSIGKYGPNDRQSKDSIGKKSQLPSFVNKQQQEDGQDDGLVESGWIIRGIAKDAAKWAKSEELKFTKSGMVDYMLDMYPVLKSFDIALHKQIEAEEITLPPILHPPEGARLEISAAVRKAWESVQGKKKSGSAEEKKKIRKEKAIAAKTLSALNQVVNADDTEAQVIRRGSGLVALDKTPKPKQQTEMRHEEASEDAQSKQTAAESRQSVNVQNKNDNNSEEAPSKAAPTSAQPPPPPAKEASAPPKSPRHRKLVSADKLPTKPKQSIRAAKPKAKPASSKSKTATPAKSSVASKAPVKRRVVAAYGGDSDEEGEEDSDYYEEIRSGYTDDDDDENDQSSFCDEPLTLDLPEGFEPSQVWVGEESRKSKRKAIKDFIGRKCVIQ